MATRLKTVEYAFDTTTSGIPATTRHEMATKTITISETNSRTFRAAYVEITFMDNTTTATSLTQWVIGLKLGAASFSDQTTTQTMTNTGEHQGVKLMSADFSSYFTTNFGSGSTQTCQVAVNISTLPIINITAKLIITYEFEDTTNDTRTCTARIPLESPTAVLTASLASIGSNQIPTLTGPGGFLPESNVSIKDLWFEIEGNESNTATTDFQLAMALDSEVEVLNGLHEQALQSARWVKHIWRRTDMTTTSGHDFKMRSTVASRLALATVTLYVTYTYTHSTTTTVLNSLILGYDITGPLGNGATDLHRFKRSITIAEPGPITLKQSALRVNYSMGATNTFSIRVGPQVARAYVQTAGTLTCGQHTFQHRFDSGATTGSGFVLSRGANTIQVEVWANSAATATNVSGYFLLNYHSGKSDIGADAHNHSVSFPLFATSAAGTNLSQGSLTTPSIPENNYDLRAVSYCMGITSPGSTSIILDAEVNGSDGLVNGWVTLGSDTATQDGEIGYGESWVRARDMFYQYPNHPDAANRMDIELARGYRIFTSASTHKSLAVWITYHAMTYAISGTISNYSGATVSGLTVKVYDPFDVYHGSTTTSSSGTYTYTVYDQIPGYVTLCRVSPTLMGRSDTITPV